MRDPADELRAGGVVAFPTETVYGLGADATNAAAVAKIFALKGRPATNPLIAHVASEAIARRFAAVWDERASKLAAAFWPGPLTIVVPRTPPRAGGVCDLVTAGLDTVGLRMPAHPVALALLKQFGGAIAAPSANKSNHVSPTTAQHVRDEFGDALPMILDGGPCTVGIESTVISLVGDRPRVLRLGAITPAMIEAVIGPVEGGATHAPESAAASSPGQQAIHYAPTTPAFRFEPREREMIALDDAAVIEITLDPETYARHLYARLRLLDTQSLRAIYVELPPSSPAWAAVRDRVMRATKPLVEDRILQ